MIEWLGPEKKTKTKKNKDILLSELLHKVGAQCIFIELNFLDVPYGEIQENVTCITDSKELGPLL